LRVVKRKNFGGEKANVRDSELYDTGDSWVALFLMTRAMTINMTVALIVWVSSLFL